MSGGVNLRMVALSFAGAFGGMLVPVAIYLALMNGQPGMHGWGTVMATDTAFVIGCLALLGIGFTMSLFIAGLAYGPAMLTAAKIGILCGSAVSAAAGFIMLIWLTSRRKTA